MQQFVNKLTGAILGFLPIAGVLIISIFIFAKGFNIIGLLVVVALGLLSIWAGFTIYNKVQEIGIIDFLTVVSSSPDLDNLEQEPTSQTKKRLPEEFESLVQNNKIRFKGGTIRIYGDWFGRPYDNIHRLKSAQYDIGKNILTIKFSQGEYLSIYNPKQIQEAPSFLKILKADRILFTYFDKGVSKNEPFYLDYISKSKRNDFESYINQKVKLVNATSMAPALMIYG